jgi:hypothetical protein
MKDFRTLLFVLLISGMNLSGQNTFGPDQYACADGTPINIPCVGNGDWTNYQLIELGDGYFDGYAPFMCPWSMDYYPGPGDLANGQVNFCLALFNNWGDITFWDCITFFFIELPSVYAGEDQTIQEPDIVFLQGVATNYASVLWLTSGDGVFEDEANPETIYYPGFQDIIHGELSLSLFAEPYEPCTIVVMDELIIEISGTGNNSFFGPDQTVCEDIDHINLPCEVGSGFWVNYDFICYGDGYFDGYAPFMCPWAFDYYPGPGDLANAYVEFCLTLYYNDYPFMESDCIIYYFQALPSVNAGEDFTVQAGEEVSLNGYAENFSTTLWFTDGDGIFQGNTSLSTIYLPGTQDISNGSVNLCVAANAIMPCTGNTQSCLTLTINSSTCQELLLRKGWSGISLCLNPDSPSIEDIFDGLDDNLIIMYSADGMWFPQAGINTLGNWDNNSAYVIKVENNTNLSIAGYPLTNKTVSLQSGWNYLPVLTSIPINCNQLFSSVLNDVIIVKEIAGTKVFWPAGDINTLDSLYPGVGYLIKTSGNINISFP